MFGEYSPDMKQLILRPLGQLLFPNISVFYANRIEYY